MIDATTITAQIYEHINNMSSVSLEKICDEVCDAKFTNKMCTVCKDETPIITSARHKRQE